MLHTSSSIFFSTREHARSDSSLISSLGLVRNLYSYQPNIDRRGHFNLYASNYSGRSFRCNTHASNPANADLSMRLRGSGARRLIKGKGTSGSLALAKRGVPKGKGSAALAEYIKRKRDKQIRRNQRKHREEIIENREECKQLKKISDIFWSAHLKDEVSATSDSVGFDGEHSTR